MEKKEGEAQRQRRRRIMTGRSQIGEPMEARGGVRPVGANSRAGRAPRLFDVSLLRQTEENNVKR